MSEEDLKLIELKCNNSTISILFANFAGVVWPSSNHSTNRAREDIHEKKSTCWVNLVSTLSRLHC